ncbi:MAG: N-formylglutamate amidohydrolase, partial [Stellaceae bacterium]
MPETLLRLGDPAPVALVRAEAAAPVLITCDHASNRVPRALERLGLPQSELLRHIGWDIGAAQVAEALAARLDAPAIFAGYSRLVIDCNRDPADPSSIPEVSDGTQVL